MSWGDIVRGDIVLGDIVRGDIVRGILSGGILSGGYCLGGFCPGGILSGGILSGGYCPGGYCPGGYCPRTFSSMAYLETSGCCPNTLRRFSVFKWMAQHGKRARNSIRRAAMIKTHYEHKLQHHRMI